MLAGGQLSRMCMPEGGTNKVTREAANRGTNWVWLAGRWRVGPAGGWSIGN